MHANSSYVSLSSSRAACSGRASAWRSCSHTVPWRALMVSTPLTARSPQNLNVWPRHIAGRRPWSAMSGSMSISKRK
eukprot:859036-Amphidinium_carterae.1